MNLEDELIRMLDKDPEVTQTVDQAIKNTCAGDVVSFSHFKWLKTTYKGWKPLSMADYIDKLNGTRFQAMQKELELQRQKDNDKVKRAHRMPVQPKKDK